jgi:opacity protein-like surface antigen
MKRHICRFFLLFAVTLSASHHASGAVGPATLAPGFYIGGGAGANFMEDTKLKQFVDPISGVNVHFDPGVSFDVHGGYRFCEFFALEGQTGMDANSIHSITGATFSDANIYQVPFIANAVINLPTHSPLSLFMGAGAGGVASVIDINDITIPSIGTVFGTDTDVTFAYQVFGGIEYALNDRLSVGGKYSYRSVQSPRWGRAVIIETGHLQNHSVTVGVNFHF